ncbi:MAG: ankyrin repeat domain-containing protein, partial [Treponema sp.]|nr:ankyrin repeat domain-containing protein [Treponema sp.]
IRRPYTYNFDVYNKIANIVLEPSENAEYYSYKLNNLKMGKIDFLEGDYINLQFCFKASVPLDYINCTLYKNISPKSKNQNMDLTENNDENILEDSNITPDSTSSELNTNKYEILGSIKFDNPLKNKIILAQGKVLLNEPLNEPVSIIFYTKSSAEKKSIKLNFTSFDNYEYGKFKTKANVENLNGEVPQEDFDFIVNKYLNPQKNDENNNQQESEENNLQNDLTEQDNGDTLKNDDEIIENKTASDSLSAKKTKKSKNTKNDLPENIQEIIDSRENTPSCWYISQLKGGKKVGKIVYGPFISKEEAISVWLYKNLKSKNKNCVSKNQSYVTDSPEKYFSNEYKMIKDYIQENGSEAALNYFFIDFNNKNIVTEVLESFIEENELVETESFQDNSSEISENKEESADSLKQDQDVYEAPFFEIPSKNENKIGKYDREYLQDFAPQKKLNLPTETVQETIIDNPNERDAFGKTLLMEAAKSGNNWLIKSLLSSGADVNLVDQDGWSPLMYAVRYQENYAVTETLINAGAKIKVKNNYNLTPLTLAASYNSNPEILRKLLTAYSVSEKEVLQAFVLLLTENISSDFSKIAIIKSFLEKSVPLNTFYNGKTPLMYAAEYGNSTKILKILIDAGSITSVRSTENKTAFDYAMENNNLAHDDNFWALNKK